MCELCYGCTHFQVCMHRDKIEDALDDVLIPIGTGLYNRLTLVVESVLRHHCHYREEAPIGHKSRGGAALPGDNEGDAHQINGDLDQGDKEREQDPGRSEGSADISRAVCHGDKGSGWKTNSRNLAGVITKEGRFIEVPGHIPAKHLLDIKDIPDAGHKSRPDLQYPEERRSSDDARKLKESGRWVEPCNSDREDGEKEGTGCVDGCFCIDCYPLGVPASLRETDHVPGCRCTRCEAAGFLETPEA